MIDYRPLFQAQLPPSNCVIDGRKLGGVSCTAYSMAMGIDAASGGIRNPSGCKVRSLVTPRDIVGGLTLRQVAPVALSMGLPVEVHTGADYVDPVYIVRQLRAGRPIVVQGNTSALLGTRLQSTVGPVNHAVMVLMVDGGSHDVPERARVYDPAADGRRSNIALGPDWWKWDRVLRFAAELRPWGDDDERLLGPGRMYVALLPRLYLRAGATEARPFPDRTRAVSGGANVRSQPRRDAPILRKLVRGELWEAFQYLTSDGIRWTGDRYGAAWVNAAKLTHLGGVS